MQQRCAGMRHAETSRSATGAGDGVIFQIDSPDEATRHGLAPVLPKSFSLALALVFAVTGMLFLIFPGDVLALFNTVSSRLGMDQSPVAGFSIYLILAVGYMYMVTLLAFLSFRHPENRYFPGILIHAKLASSALSLAMFLLDGPYLIYLTNFFVDGAIGIGVWIMYRNARRTVWASC